ncbi:hypothetical protein P5673_022410, partial [Acropora cervicornis]
MKVASRRVSRSAYARTSSLDLDDNNHTGRYLKLLVKYKSSGTSQHLAEHRIASTFTTSSTLDKDSFNENRLRTMFHGNNIPRGVFKIYLAPAKNEIKSPEVDPK